MNSRFTRASAAGFRFAVLSLALGIGSAQQYNFRQYGPADGLENLAILSLAQDRQGFIWAGSEGGLYRYDGARYRRMGAAEGLPCSAEAQALYAAQDGSLWVSTCSKLFRFDGKRFDAISGINEMLPRAQAMAEDEQGAILVATRSGLYRVERGRTAAVPAGLDSAPAHGIFREGDRLWYGCGGKLCLKTKDDLLHFGPEHGLPEDSWDGIAATPDGTIWARSTSRLYWKPAGSDRFLTQPGIGSSMYWGAIAIGPDGALMVPTDKGIAMLIDGRWRLLDASAGLPTSMATAVLRDRQGSIWAGLAGGGVARCIDFGEWQNWTKAQGLADDLVWNILRDRRGTLWVATNAGLTRFEGGFPGRKWTRADGLAGDNVRWLGETSGTIWAISRPGGLAKIDPASGKVTRIGALQGLTGNLQRGLVDRLGRLWIAGNGGIFRCDRPDQALTFTKLSLAEQGFWALAEGHDGTIWASGINGLFRYRDGTWTQYRKKDGLPADDCYVLAIAPDDSLWIRHRFDGGVDRVEFDGGGIVRSRTIVPVSPGPGEVTAFHGFDHSGNFWRGTATGVDVLRDGRWMHYGVEDGLIWNDCDGEAFLAEADGSVWIGTSGGLSHFRPKLLPVGAPQADPILASLEVSQRPRLVRALFATLAYRYEQTTRYAYRLDDDPWTEAKDRSVSIAGLAPGPHRIEVRSRVRDESYSDRIAAATFAIDAFWWETWWFRASLGLATLLLALSGVRWRHRALEARNAALEGAVRERTAELEAERVRVLEEKARADEANAAKGLFLAHMSHEIRTPLNGVLGLARSIENSTDLTEIRENVRLIESSGETLLRVINDILDFSKVDAGKLELETRTFPLRRVLAECVGLFRTAAEQKQLTLELQVAADVPEWVAGDETRLRQVVMNLLSNAIKFTSSGRVWLFAAEESSGDSTHTIQFEAGDTGTGIPPERLTELFEPFRQADSSITRRFGGTGLGLAIARKMVELMGGTIKAESTVGQGTVFRFTARFQHAVSNSAGSGRPAQESRAPLDLKILLAEDNKVNQRVALRFLQELGVRADAVADGNQAVAAASQERYDVILMDVQMPEMDGLSATREIRSRLPKEQQPCICGLSAHADLEFRQRCLASGMDGYLTKPLDFEQLREMLASVASRRVPA